MCHYFHHHICSTMVRCMLEARCVQFFQVNPRMVWAKRTTLPNKIQPFLSTQTSKTCLSLTRFSGCRRRSNESQKLDARNELLCKTECFPKVLTLRSQYRDLLSQGRKTTRKQSFQPFVSPIFQYLYHTHTQYRHLHFDTPHTDTQTHTNTHMSWRWSPRTRRLLH